MQPIRHPISLSLIVALLMTFGAHAAEAKKNQIDLQALGDEYRNALVRVEFTPIANYAETKLNPSRSERYYGRDTEGAHGTGFFINENEILTNAHVVERARRGSIRIKSPATGNVEFKVEISGLGSSNDIDLAILRLPEDEKMRFAKRSGLKKIPALSFGDSLAVKQSDPLAILGYPTRSDELKIIQAEVTGRQYLTWGFGVFPIKHQFIEVGPGGVVQRGNSGGPALDINGKVVGIPTKGDYRGNNGWLIPSAVVKRFVDRIRDNDLGTKPLGAPKLGVVITRNFPGTSVWAGAPEDLTIFELGVVVREVLPKFQGEKWGLKSGDIIVGFANEKKNISCALDFEGYCVVTGKMARWPQNRQGPSNLDAPKMHLEEMVFSSDEGDTVTLWYIRPDADQAPGTATKLKKVDRKVKIEPQSELPRLGMYDKPDYEMWGDFVAQDFNSFNTSVFHVPAEEYKKGGVLVTYVETNSLASNRGLHLSGRSGGRWYIVDSVNGEKVSDLKDLRRLLRKAELGFVRTSQSPAYKPARRILLMERYIQLGVRMSSSEDENLRMTPAFPIDEAMECQPKLMENALAALKSEKTKTPHSADALATIDKNQSKEVIAMQGEDASGDLLK